MSNFHYAVALKQTMGYFGKGNPGVAKFYNHLTFNTVAMLGPSQGYFAIILWLMYGWRY